MNAIVGLAGAVPMILQMARNREETGRRIRARLLSVPDLPKAQPDPMRRLPDISASGLRQDSKGSSTVSDWNKTLAIFSQELTIGSGRPGRIA